MRPAFRIVTPLLLLALVVPATLPAVEAQGPTVLRWDYTVRVPDPTTGRVDVTLQFTNLEGVVDRVGLLTEAHDWPLTHVRSGTGTLEPMTGGVQLAVDSDVESVSFTVDVRRQGAVGRTGEHVHGGAAGTDGEQYNAFLGGEFGVFKAESLALGFNYTYVQGTPFEWASRVSYHLPPGWSVEMPYPRTTPTVFELPPGQVLPRGFVAMGGFETETHHGAGKEFRYARLGATLGHDDALFPYLEKATGYYERIYGNATGDVILAISAPSPMFRGGLGGTDSLYVHEESDLRVLAHEYAHVWQNFATVTRAGESTTWLNEGDADYHGTLSLFATDHWSLSEVNALFEDWHAEGRESPYRGARLPQATYGNEREDLAYHKGALVLHALDAALRDATSGETGLSDLLRALNAAHDQRVTGEEPAERQKRLTPVTNAEVLDTVNALAGADFTPFFDEYVFGPRYPTLTPVATEENLVLAAMELTPERPREGEPVRVDVVVENRGLGPAAKTIPLILDGDVVGEQDVTVGVGQTTRVGFTLEAPAPGPHQLRAFYLEKWFDVVTPAKFVVERAATVPRTPAAGEETTLLAYVRNTGDLAGDARVEILIDRFEVAGTTPVHVDGNGTQAVSTAWTFLSNGAHTVTVRVVGGDDPPEPYTFTVEVALADRDGDGVPDVRDAYPENPNLTTKNVGNDVKNVVPSVGGIAAAIAVVGLALVASRRQE